MKQISEHNRASWLIAQSSEKWLAFPLKDVCSVQSARKLIANGHGGTPGKLGHVIYGCEKVPVFNALPQGPTNTPPGDRPRIIIVETAEGWSSYLVDRVARIDEDLAEDQFRVLDKTRPFMVSVADCNCQPHHAPRD